MYEGDELHPNQDAVIETLDIFLDLLVERKTPTTQDLGEDTDSPTSEDPLTTLREERDLNQVIEARRMSRTAELSRAQNMWREHKVLGKPLDLDKLRSDIVEMWEGVAQGQNEQLRASFDIIVAGIRFMEGSKAQKQAALGLRLRERITGFKSVSGEFLDRGLGDKELFLEDFEIALGDKVEECYSSHQQEIKDSILGISLEAAAFSDEAMEAFCEVVNMKKTALAFGLHLIVDFDTLDNTTILLVPAEGSSATVPGAAKVRKQLLNEINENANEVFYRHLLECIGFFDQTMASILDKSLSPDAISRLDVYAIDFLELMRSLNKFASELEKRMFSFVEELRVDMEDKIAIRTKLQHKTVSQAMGKLKAAFMETNQEKGKSGVTALLKEWHRGGIEVDESRRLPLTYKKAVLPSGTSYLNTKHISALVYNLRHRAAHQPLLDREVFLSTVRESAKNNMLPAVWTDLEKLRGIADSLDPLRTGKVLWRRFVHALICGLLPSLPSLEALVAFRQAFVEDDREEERAPQTQSLEEVSTSFVAEEGIHQEKATIAQPAVLKVSTDKFLDAPWWLDGLSVPNAKAIKELYAVAFTEDDDRISITDLLLVWSEVVRESASKFYELRTFAEGLWRAIIVTDLSCYTMDPKALFEHLSFPRPLKASYSLLTSVLEKGTYLHSVENAESFMKRCIPNFLPSAAEDGQLDIGNLLGSENVQEEVHVGLYQIIDVYGLLGDQ